MQCIIAKMHGPPVRQIRFSARIYGTLAFFSLISPAGFDQKAGLAIISPMPDALSGTKKEIGGVGDTGLRFIHKATEWKQSSFFFRARES